MLRPDAAQQPRLEEIITNLGERLAEARDRGWLGDVDGLEASLAAAQRKLVQMRRTAVNLGLPAIPPQATTARLMLTNTTPSPPALSAVGAVASAPVRAHDRYAMFERYTDRAHRVVVLAQEEARMLSHNYIGTEHILLGLIHEGEGVAAKALESLGISLEAVRAQVEEIIGQGQQAPSGRIPFTARAKKVLELSLREALQLGHNYIGTEHILLGLIREGEGVAAQVLVKLGADLNRVRQQVIHQLSTHAGGEGAPSQPSGKNSPTKDWNFPTRELTAHAPFAARDQVEEIRALLREIVERLERIERHQTKGDDTP